MSSAICFNLAQSKILLSGNGLIYLFQLDKDEVKQLGVGSCSVPNSGSQNSLSPDPLTYKQLEANKNIDGIKDWVGIVHKAVHSYSAEKAGDLEFEEGDLVTVFQVC